MTHLQVIKGGEVLGMGLADYVWLGEDGEINFKKKSILIAKNDKGDPAPLAERWTFANCNCNCDNGLSCSCDQKTNILVPCFYLPDPTRPQPNYIVLCELRDEQDHCTKTNERAKLRKALKDRGPTANLVWYGFEQDYEHIEAGEQEGDAFEARRFGVAERHIGACFDAGLLFHSAWNPPGDTTWDFKVGYRGFPQDLDPDPPNALIVADHLIVARYLMEKICGSQGLRPYWGHLTPFLSTPALRDLDSDQKAESEHIERAVLGLGDPRILPHPTRGGFQCIEVGREEPGDPYRVALDVLNAVWPLEESSTPEE